MSNEMKLYCNPEKLEEIKIKDDETKVTLQRIKQFKKSMEKVEQVAREYLK